MGEAGKRVVGGDLAISGVIRALELERDESASQRENSHRQTELAHLAEPGKMLEISGDGASARITTAVAIVRQAQLEGETTAWIQPSDGPLFPPDFAASGVDLNALVVIHIEPTHGRRGIPRAAELLLRSGAFGLVVMDLSEQSCTKANWQARLQGLARLHQSRLVVLTRKRDHTDSLGPLVNLRVAPTRVARHSPPSSGKNCMSMGFDVQTKVLKDKTGHRQTLPPSPRRGPWGLG